MRFLVYLLLFGLVLYVLSAWGQHARSSSSPKDPAPKARRWFRGKKNPREVWVQVYETATLEEARSLQARFQEEELECILYEQGKIDIHGNPLKGVGIAVPKTAAAHAQRIISNMPA